MRPKQDDVVKKCEVETKRLFELFLDVSDPKYQSKETDEVHYQVRERDTQLRSGSFGSAGTATPITLRGPGDVSNYQDAVDEKRRSFELSGTPPLRYGSSPTLGTSPITRTLELDSARAPSPQSDFSSLSYAAGFPSSANVIMRPKTRDIRQRPPSGPPTYTPFPSEKPVRSKSGPSEEILTQTAQTIAAIGDDIDKVYKDRMSLMTNQLLSLLHQNTDMSFEVFAAYVNGMVGEDRGWTNLVFVMHLGRRLFKTSSSVGVDLRDYFGRFLAGAFSEQIAQSGSAEQYVREHASSPIVPNQTGSMV